VRTVAEKLAGQAAVIQISTQDSPFLATRFGIRGIPVIVLLRQGHVVDQLPGAQPLDAVMAWFRQKAQ
jgi:thioredoxin 2